MSKLYYGPIYYVQRLIFLGPNLPPNGTPHIHSCSAPPVDAGDARGGLVV